MMKLFFKTLVVGFRLVAFAVRTAWLLLEFAVYLIRGGVDLAFKVKDVHTARRALSGGPVTCPRGHRIPTEGVYQCSACQYIYEGSVWKCANPECGATTSHISCHEPDCRLSVRNPYRWGRP